MVTSDRIAVMNAGASSRWTSRARSTRGRARASSAGFIGRTNFLDAEVRGDDVVFDGFAISRARFAESAALAGA